MTSRTVFTKDEFKKSIEDGVDEIIVQGKLASDLHDAYKITTLSAASIAALTAALTVGIASSPFTGGISIGITAAVATPIAISSGLSVPAVLLAASLGIALIIAIYRDYSFEYDANKKILRFYKK